MASSASSNKSPRPPLTIYLPPGPLGIGIKMSSNGECIVSSKSSNSKSPLKLCDVLLSLNGIPLVDVDGGVDAWCTLFGAFDTVERKVKVHRFSSDTAKSSSESTKNDKKVHVLQNSDNNSSMQDDYAANKKQKIINYNCSSDKSNNNVEIISLLDDTDEEEDDKKVGAPTSSLDSVEIMEDVSSPTSFASTSSSSLSSGRSTSRGNLKDDRNYGHNNNTSATENNSSGNKKGVLNDDEELMVVATKGQNALADFPHLSICCFFMGYPFLDMNCFSSHLMFTLCQYPISIQM